MSTREKHHDFLIDRILPAYEVHIVGGPSGAGKTTWLLALLDSWRQNQPVFGYSSHASPFLYISLDRSENGMKRTLERMRLPKELEESMVVPDENLKFDKITPLLTHYHTRFPLAKLYVIEGFASMVENINSQKEVSKHLKDARHFANRHEITIIGVVHTAKIKQNAKYENPRERLAGCAAWAGYTETIIMIEPKTDGSGVEADLRSLQILPRNEKNIYLTMEFKDGRLVEQTKSLSNEQKIMQYCVSRPPDQPFSTDDFRAVTGISDAQLFRVLEAMTKTGRLLRLEKGSYRFVPPTNKLA